MEREEETEWPSKKVFFFVFYWKMAMFMMMSAHRDTPRHHQAQSGGTIRGRFRQLITHDQSRRAGLLWDSASSPPDPLHPRGFNGPDRYDNNNNRSYYYSVAVAPHGGPNNIGMAEPRAPPAPPPPTYEPEGFASFFWTPEEDRQLLELREKCKLDWEEIAERLRSRRSASACCSRYNRTLFNKQNEKMASKTKTNRGKLPAVEEQEQGREGIHRNVSISSLPETSPYSVQTTIPMVSPSSSSLPDCRDNSNGYCGLSNPNLDEKGDQRPYQLRPAPEPLEPKVADTCSDVLTEARFCLSVGL
ncbi:hypothetical protein PG993_000785 [Apiospora rasikravindrae]|uniref:Myb-like domain-containing protein n=1 Tax=Apiospora rasikravindrae TaxID=990691 RepID=A0ABR1U9K4_9PEZI